MCGPDSGITQPLSYRFTSQQTTMIDVYQETLRYGGDELLLASRGEGKTTYFRAVLWKSVVDGTVDFAALISATGRGAIDSAEAIKDMIVRSEPFAELYPEIALPARRVGNTPQLANAMRATGVRMDNGEYFERVPIGFTWSADIDMPDVPGSPSARAMLRFRGADSPIRGLNIYGKRPKVVGLDDIDTNESVNNPDVAKKIIDRINLDIGGLGTQTDPLPRVMLATLPKQACGVAHHYATVGHPFVVRSCRYLVEKPMRWDLWMQYVKLRQSGKSLGDKYGRKAYRFYLANRADMDAGAVVSNEHRYKSLELPDGSPTQVSALQNYFDEWADKGEMFCRCELDNELIQPEMIIDSQLEMGHVVNCESDFERKTVRPDTNMIVAAIDVRKIELHYSVCATDNHRTHRIADYDVRSHASTEITIAQAESVIYEALHELADHFDETRYVDNAGGEYGTNLTLIDKGWLGNWREDGEVKTWASQPVERFCMERGLRRWLPAKGQPAYRSPAPSEKCIVGDNWHMNRGDGVDRKCTEVIWSTEHWNGIVEQTFMLGADDPDRFEIFTAIPGIHENHKRLSEHIYAGAQDLAERRRKAQRTRKPKYRRDHWWDAFSMMLVARSIELWFRANLKRRPPRVMAPPKSGEMPVEIGAR